MIFASQRAGLTAVTISAVTAALRLARDLEGYAVYRTMVYDSRSAFFV